MSVDYLYLHNLGRAITAMHGCGCVHVVTSTVKEMSGNETVWQGPVETFALDRHPAAKLAFGWGEKDAAGEIRYIAVLGVPPINSAREAVQAHIVKQSKSR